MDPTSGETDESPVGLEPAHVPNEMVTRLDALRQAGEALEAALAAGRRTTNRRD